MPFQASFEVEAGKTWGYYEPAVRYILDSFNRPSGTLGISTNGQPWTTLAGTWYVNNNYQAETDNAVTSGTGPYPLASYDLVDTNQLAYANVSPGMGVAFSIQNANNWYAIVNYDYNISYSCGCTTCYYCNTCTYCSSTGTSCSTCGSTCGAGHVDCCSCCLAYTTGANCGACGQTGYTCNCSTCYNYYYNLTVLQSINGTVYTLSTTSLTQDPTSISVKVNNGAVSYYAYSTNISGIVTQPNGLGTVLASGSLTISGTFGTQVGMVKSPSYYIQGTTISGFFGTGL